MLPAEYAVGGGETITPYYCQQMIGVTRTRAFHSMRFYSEEALKVLCLVHFEDSMSK